MTSIARRLLGTIATLTLLGVIAGCNTQTTTTQTPATQTQAAQQTIRIGYVRWGLLPIVRERKVLEQELAKQNIRVEWVGPFPAFAPVIEAFNANAVDFSAGGDIPGISGLVGGALICVLAYQAPIPEAEAILVPANSPIRSPADLVGKTVAVNRGGWGEHLLLKVLAEANIPKEKVQRAYLSPTDALPAITQGHVDAWSVWDPNVAIGEVQHDLRPIATGQAASHYGIYVVNRQTLANKPQVVKAVLEAITQEADWAVSHRPEAAAAFGKSTNLAADVIKQLGDRRLVAQVLPLTPAVLTGIQERADWMYQQQSVPKQIDIRQSVCPSTPGLEAYTNIPTN